MKRNTASAAVSAAVSAALSAALTAAGIRLFKSYSDMMAEWEGQVPIFSTI